MKYHWQCKICGQAGVVKCWLFSDLEKILKKVEQNHKKVSPDCSCPVNKLNISSDIDKKQGKNSIFIILTSPHGMFFHKELT